MLGKELNSLKQSLHSKSSILHEDMDEKSTFGPSHRTDRPDWGQRQNHSQADQKDWETRIDTQTDQSCQKYSK